MKRLLEIGLCSCAQYSLIFYCYKGGSLIGATSRSWSFYRPLFGNLSADALGKMIKLSNYPLSTFKQYLINQILLLAHNISIITNKLKKFISSR